MCRISFWWQICDSTPHLRTMTGPVTTSVLRAMTSLGDDVIWEWAGRSCSSDIWQSTCWMSVFSPSTLLFGPISRKTATNQVRAEIGSVQSVTVSLLNRFDLRRMTTIYFLHSYLCQLFWPQWCRASKCKHFAALSLPSGRRSGASKLSRNRLI